MSTSFPLKSCMRALTLGMIGLLSLNLHAQHSHPMAVGFAEYAQSLEVSPSTMPNYRFNLGLPHYDFHLLNSFTLDNLFRSSGDSVILNVNRWASPQADPIQMNLENRIRLLSLGFHLTKEAYVYAGASVQAMSSVSLPGGLLQIATNSTQLNLDRFALNAMAYTDWHVGGIYQWQKFTFGAKARFLNGLVNLNTARNELEFVSNTDKIDLSADLLLQSSNLTETDLQGVPTGDFPSPEYLLLRTKNPGFAMDLGTTYQINSLHSIEASVLNLGGIIRWQDNVTQIRYKGSYQYQSPLIQIGQGDDFPELFEGIGDSLDRNFALDTSTNTPSYTTALPTQLLLHYQYRVHNNLCFGGIFRHTFQYGDYAGYRPWISAYAQVDLRSVLSARLNLGLSGVRKGVGAMLALRLLGIQTFLQAENFQQFYAQSNAGAFQFSLGLNIAFGNKRQRLN